MKKEEGSLRLALVVDSATARGGTQTYLSSLNQELQQRGFQCRLISRDQYPRPGAFLDAVSHDAPNLICLSSVLEPETMQSIASLAPAVVWLHDYAAVCPGHAKFLWRSERACRIASGWRCLPSIYLQRCSSARSPKTAVLQVLRSQRHKGMLAKIRTLVVASQYVKQVLCTNGLDPNRIEVVPYYPVCPTGERGPVETQDFILYAGRLEREKGVSWLLRAMSLTDGDLRLEIAGEGSEGRVCRRMAEKLRLTDRVRFLGWLSEVEMDRKLRECRFLVMPSVWPEPYGIVGVEALARGKPVIAFNTGGIREWLQEGVSGYLVRPFRTDEMAERMESLWADASRSRRMGETGREFVERNLNKSLHLDRLCELFRQAAAGPGDP